MNKYFTIFFLIVFSFLLAGCQKSEEKIEHTNPSAETSNSVVQKNYIGLSIKDGQELAGKNKVFFRVVKQDGKDLPVTMDFVPGRINAVIEDNVVVSYSVEGE